MRKIFAIPFSILAYLWFFVSICFFHPIQWICLNVFGYQAHKKSVDILNGFLISTLYLLLTDFRIENRELIPTGKPLIIVANHQGLFDIIGLGWFLMKFHPKYVSKIELGKGIPSVSYNVRHGGSVMIDRNDPKQALPALKQMGEYIQANYRSVVIFPEGTRTKDGKPKSFAPNGLKILCKYAPDAYVVPISINNSWKVFQYGGFPLGIANRLRYTVHTPIAVKECDFAKLFEQTEKAVLSGIDGEKG
jgi:1-acyl-sn-glycerol-3-phosphate acyltransferase